ncbi:MAG: DegV family protein [Anaerolineae bacterium]|nr:DegV family protein [Anaerolineae bacterium]
MIRIVTDSTANVPTAVVERYGIEVVPLRVIFPDITYRDQVDITAEEFYRLLPHCETLPTTSQPPASEFEDAFRRLSQDGSQVIAILISSKLSGTVASATAAQRALPDLPVTVFDSWTTSALQAFMVEHAAEKAAQGATMQEVVQDLEVLKARSQILFTIETFRYLQKGGRIGNASALAASVLRIQPILTLNQGVVDVWGKVRGKRRALQVMMETARERGGTGEGLRVAVVHASAPDVAAEMADDVTRQLQCPRPELMQISPVIGTHVGPGAIGLGYYHRDWL